jgi:hypothetical protein
MLDHEYRKQQEQQIHSASWPIRLVFGVLALFIWSGVVAVWKFVGHDGYIIVAVIIPLAFLGVILSLAAFTANRRSTRDFVDAALSLIYFWG